MRKLLFLLLFIGSVHSLHAQFTIPDPAFAAKLQQIVPSAMNGNVLDTNHVDVLSTVDLTFSTNNIADISGVQFFSALEILDCQGSFPSGGILATIPALPNSLKQLICAGNQLTSLPMLPGSLEILGCAANQLAILPSLPGSLKKLICYENQLTSLPTLSNSLEEIRCQYNQLTLLPYLPASIEVLDCSYNQLSTFPSGGAGLVFLWCNSNQLTSLPTLPNTMYTLECQNNPLVSLPSVLPNALWSLRCDNGQLQNLPALPNTLVLLNCGGNQLQVLPSLPNSLAVLDCGPNQLSSLPALPVSLIELDCSTNPLGSLTTLPSGLKELYCSNVQITSLSNLPSELIELRCSGNQLTCLPALPSTLDVLKCFGNFLTCLPNYPPLLGPFGTAYSDSNLGFNAMLCATTDPCFPSEAITGSVFSDANGNGQLDTLESPFFAGVAEAQPGNYLSGVDINGNYGLPVDTGTYTVQGQALLYHNITTSAHTVTITSGHIDSLNHIGYQAIPGIYDLVVNMNAQATRPGFDNNVYLQVKNIGTEATTATIDLGFDADQMWISSTVTPATQAGTNVNWSVPMNPGDTWNATVTLNTAASVALGTAIDHVLTATPTLADTTAGDNVANWNGLVVGSYDPNDKRAVPSSMDPTQLLSGDAIEYTIRFQNTGTFMAENVRITDTLSAGLEWGSFEYISSSHSNYWYLSNGVLVFQYDNIQLPDSTSDEPNSHGFVKFRIKPSQNLLVGDSVLNTANIYFDFNEPVITDPSVFIIDITSGVGASASSGLQVYPNPTNGVLNLRSETEMHRATIYQLDGRMLRSERASGTQHQVQLADLKQGLYLLEVEIDGGRFTSRVLKR